MEKSFAIKISEGNIKKVYEIKNPPEHLKNSFVVVNDDVLSKLNSKERWVEANNQLEGYRFDGDVEYKEIHSKLSDYIESEYVLTGQ